MHTVDGKSRKVPRLSSVQTLEMIDKTLDFWRLKEITGYEIRSASRAKCRSSSAQGSHFDRFEGDDLFQLNRNLTFDSFQLQLKAESRLFVHWNHNIILNWN